jgi:hypothetical protein
VVTSTRSKTRATKRPREDEEEAANGEEEGSGSVSGRVLKKGKSTNTKGQTNTATPKAVDSTATTAPSKAIDLSAPAVDLSVPHDAPAWLHQGLALINVNLLGSLLWAKLVRLWYQREEDLGFKTQGLLKGQQRPTCISDWQKCARSQTYRPTLDTKQFHSQFWTWWALVQLEWRVGQDTAMLLKVDGKLDWATLTAAGLNGILQALAALFFWGDTIDKEGRKAEECANWTLCVSDVVWVLEKLPVETLE